MTRNPVNRIQHIFIIDAKSSQLINHFSPLAFMPVFISHLGMKSNSMLGTVLQKFNFFLNVNCEFNVSRNHQSQHPMVALLKVFLTHDKTLVYLQGQIRPTRC
jgi:hypothetical protein